MRKAITILLSITALIVGAFLLAIYFGPPGPNIVCHRYVDGSFEQWKLITTNANWFPNVEGSSVKSLAVLGRLDKTFPDALGDYRYIPGLKSDDPKELILMYVKEPSRRKWHGDGHWFRREKGWVVLNPPMKDGEGDKWSEAAEWIPTEEFTNRLGNTLHFLSENRRDHWTNIIKEHAAFLQMLQKSKR